MNLGVQIQYRDPIQKFQEMGLIFHMATPFSIFQEPLPVILSSSCTIFHNHRQCRFFTPALLYVLTLAVLLFLFSW